MVPEPIEGKLCLKTPGKSILPAWLPIPEGDMRFIPVTGRALPKIQDPAVAGLRECFSCIQNKSGIRAEIQNIWLQKPGNLQLQLKN